MARQELQGTLEEQCEFLYGLAVEKMQAGNFSGAVYALKELHRHNPGYRDVARLLAEVKIRKTRQRNLILTGLAGGTLSASMAHLLGVASDLWLIAAAAAGLVCTYVLATVFRRRLPALDSVPTALPRR
ncbi:MAG: hypothetical protein OXH72_10190 [Caldilineaceae bacterium]|nr:hypothetical protein [Caldilineaceae bacterium]MXZ25722.1 hypothetical protein [Caldilineaceae bacterium SB0665_bin_21]